MLKEKWTERTLGYQLYAKFVTILCRHLYVNLCKEAFMFVSVSNICLADVFKSATKTPEAFGLFLLKFFLFTLTFWVVRLKMVFLLFQK